MFMFYDCKSTQFPQHGKIYFLVPNKKCIFAAEKNISLVKKYCK